MDSYPPPSLPVCIVDTPRECGDPDWSADGEWICFKNYWSSGDVELLAVSVSTGQLWEIIPRFTIPHIHDPVWSPDGTAVVFQCEGALLLAEFDAAVESESRTSWGAIKSLFRDDVEEATAGSN